MKKRYLFAFALFFAAGLAVSVYCDFDLDRNMKLASLAAVLGLTCVLGLLSHRFTASLFACVGLISSLFYLQAYTRILVNPLCKLANHTYVISAEVCDYAVHYDDMQCIEARVDCSALGIDYPFSTFDTLLYLPETSEPLEPGDQIRVTAGFYIPEFAEGYDRARSLAAKGYYVRASSLKFVESEDFCFEISSCGQTPARYVPLVLAQRWKNEISKRFDARESGFMISLLLGDKSCINERDYQNLQKSGLSHIVAVSGMHLMFLVAFLTQVFGKRLGTFLSIPAVLFFACMAGNTPSVMRASIMVIAAGISFLLMDEADSLTVLALSLLILLFQNPYSIASTSLQLSYLSTLGLMLYAGRIQTFLHKPFVGMKRPLRKVVSIITAAISCSCCALLFTTPVLLLTFGYVTILSPLSNLLTLSIVSLLFILGLFFCVISMFAPAWSTVLVPVAAALSRYILLVSEKCAELWWGILEPNSFYAVLAILSICLISVVMIGHKHSKPKFTLPALCVILILAVYHNAQTIQNTTTITVHSVGGGQMISVAAGRDTLSLIDCGSGSNRDAVEILSAYMSWNGFDRIDQLILTAVDKTHARGLEDLLDRYPISKIVIPNNLQPNDFVNAALETIELSGIPYVQWEYNGERTYTLSGVSCNLIGGTNRKLGVRLNTDEGSILILHSFTQKMLDELLARTELKGDILILSPGNLEKQDLLKSALDQIAPKQIIFPAGADSVASRLYGVQTRNTYLEGEIVFRTTRIME